MMESEMAMPSASSSPSLPSALTASRSRTKTILDLPTSLLVSIFSLLQPPLPNPLHSPSPPPGQRLVHLTDTNHLALRTPTIKGAAKPNVPIEVHLASVCTAFREAAVQLPFSRMLFVAGYLTTSKLVRMGLTEGGLDDGFLLFASCPTRRKLVQGLEINVPGLSLRGVHRGLCTLLYEPRVEDPTVLQEVEEKVMEGLGNLDGVNDMDSKLNLLKTVSALNQVKTAPPLIETLNIILRHQEWMETYPDSTNTQLFVSILRLLTLHLRCAAQHFKLLSLRIYANPPFPHRIHQMRRASFNNDDDEEEEGVGPVVYKGPPIPHEPLLEFTKSLGKDLKCLSVRLTTELGENGWGMDRNGPTAMGAQVGAAGTAINLEDLAGFFQRVGEAIGAGRELGPDLATGRDDGLVVDVEVDVGDGDAVVGPLSLREVLDRSSSVSSTDWDTPNASAIPGATGEVSSIPPTSATSATVPTTVTEATSTNKKKTIKINLTRHHPALTIAAFHPTLQILRMDAYPLHLPALSKFAPNLTTLHLKEPSLSFGSLSSFPNLVSFSMGSGNWDFTDPSFAGWGGSVGSRSVAMLKGMKGYTAHHWDLDTSPSSGKVFFGILNGMEKKVRKGLGRLGIGGIHLNYFMKFVGDGLECLAVEGEDKASTTGVQAMDTDNPAAEARTTGEAIASPSPPNSATEEIQQQVNNGNLNIVNDNSDNEFHSSDEDDDDDDMVLDDPLLSSLGITWRDSTHRPTSLSPHRPPGGGPSIFARAANQAAQQNLKTSHFLTSNPTITPHPLPTLPVCQRLHSTPHLAPFTSLTRLWVRAVPRFNLKEVYQLCLLCPSLQDADLTFRGPLIQDSFVNFILLLLDRLEAPHHDAVEFPNVLRLHLWMGQREYEEIQRNSMGKSLEEFAKEGSGGRVLVKFLADSE
ncbi:hypothetical protein HDV05_004592 [Chytridiales sp. JEL 0842]|nr:hypothetical protein HDV05_004592 [Chytridiales sp. JEL 0842]